MFALESDGWVLELHLHLCLRSGGEGGGRPEGRRDADIIPAERRSSDAVGGESARQRSDPA